MSTQYTLPRDSTESSRLDGQHRVWAANIGFLLHPSIAASIPPNAHIGDVGTGTGAWMLDPAQNPSYKFTGLDMSADQFPSQHPSHISFSTLNILDPIPEKWQGQFDVLHLRLLVLGLSGKDWATAASNLLKLLKPGGWLQWEEADFQALQVMQNVPGTSTEACAQIWKAVLALNNQKGRVLDEPRRLHKIIGSAGFVDARQEVFSSDRDAGTRADFNRSQMGAYEGTARSIFSGEGEVAGWTWEGFERVLEQGKRDVEGTKLYYRCNLHVTIGRRPS